MRIKFSVKDAEEKEFAHGWCYSLEAVKDIFFFHKGFGNKFEFEIVEDEE